MAEVLGLPVPPTVDERTQRGRRAMKRDAPKRRLCVRFTKGDTYSYLNEKGLLTQQATVTYATGGGKPSHRIRNTYNFIAPIVEDKVSAATQRVPSYEIDPATTDPEDISAARLAERVAIYGYDKWRIRQATVDAVKTAIAYGGVAYAMPYFDPNVGPYRNVGGEWIGEGEIKVLVFDGNSVYSEPGVKWENSPWWAVEQALPIDQVRDLPGFVGGELTPDATTSDIPSDQKDRENLVMVTRHFERPCSRYPEGRLFTIAGGRVIVDNRLIDPSPDAKPWQDYPLRYADGTVIDEPLIHRLVYTHDPDAESDLGLTWQLIDFQRTAQDCINKILEYKNRGLNLQMLVPSTAKLLTRRSDEPGANNIYQGGPNGEKPEWERPPDPSILNALESILQMILQQMKDVASYEDIHADPNVAAKTTSAVIEQSIARWQSFLGDLAEWHSRVMRHCLVLVERYYSTPRTLEIRGRTGWEPIEDFQGAKLMGQTNVRVFPGSLEYLTRGQLQNRVDFLLQIQAITPQQALATIEGGHIEKLTESYELDVAKINRVIQKIRDGSIMDMPPKGEIDPVSGNPIPGWMPDEWDNIEVWQHTLADWLKTPDYEALDPALQENAKLIWQGLQDLQTQKAQRAAELQSAMAQQQGMNNAAKPQGPKPMPSPPALANAA